MSGSAANLLEVTYTSLHRALGVPAGSVTEEMIVAAVAANVVESEDLDWKRDVDEIKDAKEFAKDVAAMANTAGGLIVFGVGEDGADHADELVGIENPKPHVQSLRGKAGMVRPFIPALRVYSMPLTALPGRHLIVVDVPRSPEAPHLVPQSKESWGLPRRRDSDTDWLGESDLEAAYAGRFRRRRAAEEHLAALAEELDDRLWGKEHEIWVTVTAACSMPSIADTEQAVNQTAPEPSMLDAIQLLQDDGELRQAFDGGTAIPKVGLRRAVVSSSSPYAGLSDKGHLELFHDGAFAGALNVAHTPPVGGIRYLAQSRMEGAIRDLVTVVALHAHRRQADGVLQIRATINVPPPGQVSARRLALTHQHYMTSTPEPAPASIVLERVAQ
ncbi:hypothetical protein BG452_17295 [Streptomyces sp. CBMA123]|nr:hypothetical protein [Streptomyces sp. CBMA123]